MSCHLVTGTAGFIASRVSQFLLDQGHKVIGIDNFDPVYDLRLKNWRLERLKAKSEFTFYKESICDRAALDRIIQAHPDIVSVINLAAKAGVRNSVLDPWSYYDTNVTGTLNLLELCRNHGIKKFILASTSSIYGENAPYPTPETTESSFPLQPLPAKKRLKRFVTVTNISTIWISRLSAISQFTGRLAARGCPSSALSNG